MINENNSYWYNATINNRKDNDEWRIAKDTVGNSFSVADEGKVVIDGKLVAQTAMPDEITENSTIDTTTYDSVTVNVSGSATGTPILATPAALASKVAGQKCFIYIRPDVVFISLDANGRREQTQSKRVYTIIPNTIKYFTFEFNSVYYDGDTYSIILNTGSNTDLVFSYIDSSGVSNNIQYNYSFQANKTYLVEFEIRKIQGRLSIRFYSATEYDEPITFTVG